MLNYDTEIPDLAYWKRQIACQNACPVRTDARGYVRAIAEGNDELAYLIARGPNPLASICGRVCGAPCETDCRRGSIDKPIAIRALKRYACERFGPEARGDGGETLIAFLKEAAERHGERACEGRNELLPLLQSMTAGGVSRVEGGSVGIIGSGPAGLGAAHDLALLGFEVTIYESEPVLAGMLATGIPEYRLPRSLVQAEVAVITAMGVKAETNCCVGEDVSLPELRERHDAVIVAVGAKRSRLLPVPGADAKGVLGGVEFLRDVALGAPVHLDKRVVVIGGGNVAYDVGRTVLRQISVDAARQALREPEVAEVHLCSLESLDEMPADDVEIIEGDEEGIVRHNSMGPKEILTDDSGAVRAVRFQRCLRVFDDERRFSPLFDENDVTDIPCETVLLSIGQHFDLSFADAERDGLTLKPNGLIACDPETGVTSAPDVYVAGDIAYGPKLLIHAVASGKAVAREIYRQATGRELRARDTELHFPLAKYAREQDYEKLPRVEISTLSPEERRQSHTAVVEHCLTEGEARREASRCLNCGVNTIFDGSRCILCGGCADVCPELCLRLVTLDQLDGDDALEQVVDRQLDGMERGGASAIIKDETACIRCGLCAERCPVGAITMEQFMFKEELACQDA